MFSSLDNMKAKIMEIRELPTLPVLATEIANLSRDPSSSISDIVKAIQTDPSITSKVLKIANSPFYGMRQRIDTINRALVVLGMAEVNNLVTSIAIFKTFPCNTDLKFTFDRNKFWKHCAITGEVAKTISLRLGLKIMSEIFTAGLLHDIGKIILDEYFHDDFSKAVSISYEKSIPLYEAEQEVFGINHSQVGAWVAERWKLPRKIVDVIGYHHYPNRPLKNKLLVSIVSLANEFSKISDNSFSGEKVQIVLEDTPAWEVIQEELPAINDIDIVKFTFELETMVANAEDFIKNVN